MKLASIVGASFVACTALLSFQGGVVASETESDQAASKAALGAGWAADMRARQFNSVVTKLNRILSSDSLTGESKAVAYINRGLANQKLELYRKAVSDYSLALSLDALSPKTRAITIYNRGLAYQKMKRQAMAIEDFTNALYLDVEFAHAYYGRGHMMQELGRYEFALADFKKAMKYRHPAAHLPFYGQALAYEATQQNTKARKALSRALLLKPDFKPALERYEKISGVAFNPRNLVLRAKTAQTVSAVQSTAKIAGNLPQAKTPPAVLFNPGLASNKTETDSIVTGSLGNGGTQRVASLDTSGVGVKLPYRYPGISGDTQPTPQMKPMVKPLDLHPAAQKQRVKKKISRIDPVLPKAKEVVKAELPKEAAPVVETKPVKVTSLGKNAGLALMNAASTQAAGPTVTEAPEVPIVGWLVQFNSQRSKKAAKSAWQHYQKKYSSVFTNTKFIMQKADLGTKGTYWRLRLGGYDKRAVAVRKCEQMKRKGLSCFVVKAG